MQKSHVDIIMYLLYLNENNCKKKIVIQKNNIAIYRRIDINRCRQITVNSSPPASVTHLPSALALTIRPGVTPAVAPLGRRLLRRPTVTPAPDAPPSLGDAVRADDGWTSESDEPVDSVTVSPDARHSVGIFVMFDDIN